MSAAIGGIAFYYAPTDEVAYRRDRLPYEWPNTLLIPDRSGNPVEKPWQNVTVSELQAASDAGLLYGDPLRPYLHPGFPQGDILGPDWLPPAIDAVQQAADLARTHAGTARQSADDASRVGGLIRLALAVRAAVRRWWRGRRSRRYESPWHDG